MMPADLGIAAAAELARQIDRTEEADTGLRQSVRDLFYALDRGILAFEPIDRDSAFIRAVRDALAVARAAHGEK